MEQEGRIVLVLFSRKTTITAAKELLNVLKPAEIQWCRIFEKRNVYAVRVPSNQADGWRKLLNLLPEVVWAQLARPL